MTRSLCAALLAALSALCVAVPASAAAPLPDAVMSSNVEYLGSIKQDVGLTTGTKIVGDRMFVAGALGCSVHWFHEHQTFRNGGLVAISEYEDGVRFLQITPDGKIQELGYFLSLGSSSSSPKWAGKDDVLYSIDYQRGIDILRWKGEHYVPDAAGNVRAEASRVRGTNGETPPPAPTAEQAARRDALAKELSDSGWSPGLCFLAAQGN